MTSRSWLVTACFALSVASASAQTSSPVNDWTGFTDPVEHAFTVDVPQGWQVAGGVMRFAPSEAQGWVAAESPDGATELFLGDPAVGMFSLPGPAFQEGAQAPGLHNRAMTVMHYRPGADFAAYYGVRGLARVCANIQVQGTQPRPDIEDEMRAKISSSTRLDAGMASFTCDRGGLRISAGVIAGTNLYNPAGVGGAWGPAILFGFRTVQGREAQVLNLLEHMRTSLKPDPQWEAALARASALEAQNIQPRPRPPIGINDPTPMPSPRPVGPRCDDLQQRRICNMNDGHPVSSGGCLVCVN